MTKEPSASDKDHVTPSKLRAMPRTPTSKRKSTSPSTNASKRSRRGTSVERFSGQNVRGDFFDGRNK